MAIVAAVFAIWPAVADAPWEEDAPRVGTPVVPVEDSMNEIRCEAALSLRETLIDKGEYGPQNTDGLRGSEYDGLTRKANREIARYC